MDNKGDVYIAWMFYDGQDSLLKILATVNDITGINKQVAGYWLMSTTGMNAYPSVAISVLNEVVSGVCSWINYDGMDNLVQAIIYTTTRVQPPINLAVTQRQNDFGILTEYYNILTWDASPSPGVNNYYIYRDGVQVGYVSLPSPFEFIDENRIPGVSVTYAIESYDSNGFQSDSASVTYSP